MSARPAPARWISRRSLLAASLAAGGVAALSVSRAFAATADAPTGTPSPVADASLTLDARPRTVDLGSRTANTWAYSDRLPGAQIRVTAGNSVSARFQNNIPAEGTIHWHGVRTVNSMDGAPHLSQHPVVPGGTFDYHFVAPDPGTYFFHSHVGTQLDRGLYGSLIVEDPHEPLGYDREYVIVLDDWLDGIDGNNPDAALAGLNGIPSQNSSNALGGTAGHILYPYYLINGRTNAAPETFQASPGQRVRLRIINAAADTAFRVALGGHRLNAVASDGFPINPVTVDTILIGMGERYDAVVTLGTGVFPLVADAEGKGGRAFAVVRTGSGSTPGAGVPVAELNGRMLGLGDMNATDAVFLPSGNPTASFTLTLGTRPPAFVWTINGHTMADMPRFGVRRGDYVRITFDNQSPIFHPMHLHGHTFQVRGGNRGPRKDTVIVRPLQRMTVDLLADNFGEWMLHCHNLLHQEAGMMASLGYDG